MKNSIVALFLFSVLFFVPTTTKCSFKKEKSEKIRLLVLTDYFKDPDDKQSLIRFLMYSNEFDVRGIIATSLAYGTGETRPDWIKELIDYYGMVQPNLLLHHPDYPSADSLKLKVKAGANVIRKYIGPRKGFPTPFGDDLRTCNPATDYIGDGKDTEGSEHIIKVIDESDLPTWVIVWGGPMDLAQALWKVKNTRDKRALHAFVGKIRYYQINWQDTGATWLWDEFPELFRIQGLHLFKGIYQEGDDAFKNQEWVDSNIRKNHGILGQQYPVIEKTDGVKEGDSPSLLYLIPNGLSNPEKPEYGSWGGRFNPYPNRMNTFIDAMDEHPESDDEMRKAYWTVARWNKAANLDFAARMDWCVKTFDEANHPPQVKLKHKNDLWVKAGSRIDLNAQGTTDPDGDELSYKWWHYKEAGNCSGEIEIENATEKAAFFTAPSNIDEEKILHVICEVTDNGSPNLCCYQRVVIRIQP